MQMLPTSHKSQPLLKELNKTAHSNVFEKFADRVFVVAHVGFVVDERSEHLKFDSIENITPFGLCHQFKLKRLFQVFH